MAEVTKKIHREKFIGALVNQIWKCTKVYTWGKGYRLIGKYEDLPKNVSLRLDVKNPTKFDPQIGEEWKVTARVWRHKEGDIDKEGRKIIYVEGFLQEKIVQVENKINHREKKLVEVVKSGNVVLKEKVSEITSDVVTYRDAKRFDRVVHMEVFYADGKVIDRKFRSEESLEQWVAYRAWFLRELLSDLLQEPYEGVVEDSIELPPFLTV